MSKQKSIIRVENFNNEADAECGRCPAVLHMSWNFASVDKEAMHTWRVEKAKLLLGWLKDHKCKTDDDD